MFICEEIANNVAFNNFNRSSANCQIIVKTSDTYICVYT